MKSASVMSSVDASRPPTLTCDPGANSTPFGLIRNTWPLEVRLPKIADASIPSTRFRATERLFGWTKTTLPPWPMEKVCQLIATFWVDWLIVIVPGLVAIVAPPAVTDPPVGSVCAWAAVPKDRDTVSPTTTKPARAVEPAQPFRRAATTPPGFFSPAIT